MAVISINNLARAIYESSLGKSGSMLDVVTSNAVDLIKKKHLMNKSKEILSSLEKIFDKNEEVVRAKVSTRIKIDKKIAEEIEDFIKKKYKVKDTVLDFQVDAKLLGGIKIEIGDEIIDTTLKNKIKKLENYLITQ
jgi:F-type H+-transporting ATPase subunit delta